MGGKTNTINMLWIAWICYN